MITSKRIMLFSPWSLALLLALALLVALPSQTARAATIIVTNGNDSGAGSLRAAIAAAQPGDTIVFNGNYAIYLSSTLAITKSLTIDGSGRTIKVSGDTGNNGSPDVRVFNIAAGKAVTLSHLSVVSGVFAFGGGIYNQGTLMLQECSLAGNSAHWDGGGVYNNGVLTVQNSVFSNNFLIDAHSGDGGGIFNAGTLSVLDSTFIGNSSYRRGGGIHVHAGTVTVQSSTLADNSASDYGGGIYVYSGTVTVQNSTITGNSSDFNGGGIHNTSVLTVLNSTIAGNSSDLNGGGIYNGGTLYYYNTLLANNSAIGGDCTNTGVIGANVHNLVEDNTCSPALSGDPALGPLADNGGGTQTFALLPNSKAIDAGKASVCLDDDQRGEPRTDLGCDIGAYELQYGDSDTVIKTGFAAGKPYSFGPTWVSMTLATAAAGSVTVTKHLTAPGGVWDRGEITATWWISSDLAGGFPVTLSLCYTDAEVADLDEDSLEMFRWVGGQWVDQNATPDPAHNCVRLAGVTGFSAWTLKDTSVGAATPAAITLSGVTAGGYPWLLPVLFGVGSVLLLRRRRR